MISLAGKEFDIIILTAEYYDDHPLSPAGVIAKVLDAKGFKVGIIEKPETNEDFTKLGAPKLCFCVTSGSIDSMLNNYTPAKRKRIQDEYGLPNKMPDRAVIVYCSKIRENFKSVKIVIGGIEASLRRFAHYDYWDNDIRRSLLFDSKANILVYGNGEKQIIEIAERLKKGEDLKGVRGTCVISKDIDSSFKIIPSFKDVKESKTKFCEMQTAFSMYENLAQEYNNTYLLQYKYPEYTSKDLNWIYSLNYSRRLNPKSLLKMAKFSVVTHRGCIGKCNFCALSLHQGDRIISRSEESILAEIKKLTKHPEFKGYIDDLGGPSANMYGMDCNACSNPCLNCSKLDLSHKKLTDLLRKARLIKGVKKVFVRSGIRYDLALNSREYLRELVHHHISGCLKIAPEHFSEKVLNLMNKRSSKFDEFVSLFRNLNHDPKQDLRYYFMICHPGDDEKEVAMLASKLSKLKNIDQFQVFTPTPMTVSSCMYWTGINPFTMEKVHVVRDYHTKKIMKRMLLKYVSPRKVLLGRREKEIKHWNSNSRYEHKLDARHRQPRDKLASQ